MLRDNKHQVAHLLCPSNGFLLLPCCLSVTDALCAVCLFARSPASVSAVDMTVVTTIYSDAACTLQAAPQSNAYAIGQCMESEREAADEFIAEDEPAFNESRMKMRSARNGRRPPMSASQRPDSIDPWHDM